MISVPQVEDCAFYGSPIKFDVDFEQENNSLEHDGIISQASNVPEHRIKSDLY